MTNSSNSFYQQTKEYYGLQNRKPMNMNLLINKGGRSIRASDANAHRKKVWDEDRDDMVKLLNTTFHSYELDRQMPMWWLLENDPESFFTNRDSEIEKGQGRVKRNYDYKEVGYQYLINPEKFGKDLIQPEEVTQKEFKFKSVRA